MDKDSLTAILNSLVHPTQLEVILRNIFKIGYVQSSNKTHLMAAIDWLCRAQDNSGTGGCSASYGFNGGYAPPYPETTGYIISTFLSYSEFSKDNSFTERARRMGDWEIEIQLPSGAVRGGSGINDYPIVFNTGMVILGWTDLYNETGDERYLSASLKAADWLCLIMDEDGKWSRDTYNGIPHTYHSRVSWALLEVYKHTHDGKYKDFAIRNIEWILSRVQENGWISDMGFFKGDNDPLTHTIAYTLRGLLESSFFFDDDLRLRIQNTVIKAAERILHLYESIKNTTSIPKLIPARINNKWQPTASYSCLTGNAQIAIIWLRLFKLNNDYRYFAVSKTILDQLKKTQNLKSNNQGIHGGIAGSYPIWGSYMQYCYPNWAAKFYADALMLLDSIISETEL